MSSSITQLKQLLRQDLADLKNLETILSEEKDLLRLRNATEIKRVTDSKSALLKQIEQRAKLKAKVLAASGWGIKPGKVGQALEALGDDELSTMWQASISALEACKQRNSVNGTIISHTLQRTAKLMNIIKGQKDSPNLYGQQGKTRAMSGNHMLGKA